MYAVTLTGETIIEAYQKARAAGDIVRTDNPGELELAEVRYRMTHLVGGDVDMLSLHWLRNKIVTLRKAGRLAESRAKVVAK